MTRAGRLMSAVELTQKHRALRLAALGPRPPWWRFFKRRRWAREFAAIMAITLAEFDMIYMDHYTPESIEDIANEPHPTIGAFRTTRKP